MPQPTKAPDAVRRQIDRMFLLIAVFWTFVNAALFAWNYHEAYSTALTISLGALVDSYNKDVVYRRWGSIHGGVYVPITPETPSNPDLAQLPERDILSPSGKKLTLMNPAYMTRQVQELGEQQYGLKGHITSLKPLRPENAADEWETKALLAFEQDTKEVVSFGPMGGETYLRFMRPFIVEDGCLKCHESQGYKLGDIRGGISVSTPWKPVEKAFNSQMRTQLIGFTGLWFVGFAGLLLVRRNIRDNLSERVQLEEEKSRTIIDLQNALAEVKKLSGILPICSSCKKIRDDKGYWEQVEGYIAEHSEAQFTHSICPDCIRKLYPEIADEILESHKKKDK